MVRRDGVIKVLDFGIARTLGMADDRVPLELVSAGRGSTAETWATDAPMAGTPGYMSPEQLCGEPIDARTDQFAWGVLAYELLTGRPPWSGDTTSYEFVANVLRDDPEPFSSAAGSERAALEAVIRRALSRDPKERFTSMSEVATEIAGGVPKAAELARATERHALQQQDTVPANFKPSRRPPLRRVPMLLWIAIATALGAGALTLMAKRSRTQTARTEVLSAAPSATKLTDLPYPATAAGEARSEYVAGVQAIRDASIIPGVRHLIRATELDPGLAVAHLRVLTHGREISETDDRAHFEKVRELRALLSPRDQALLTALEPAFLHLPPDDAEVTRRLRAPIDVYPLDAELHYLVGARESDPSRSTALFDRALALDPEFALVLWRKAAGSLVQGDLDAARASLDRCVSLVPSSSACLSVRALVNEELGRCSEMERDARVLEFVNPSARSHDLVARVLYANGAPIAAVRQALERKWDVSEKRDGYREADEAHLAILRGDFTTAEDLTKKAALDAIKSPIEEEHKNTVWPLVDLYMEMGRPELAASEADRYLRERTGWQTSGEWSPVPVMMATAVRGGRRSKTERDAALGQWSALWSEHAALFPGQSWVQGYALPASTEEDGKLAMTLAPDPLPRAHTNQFHHEGLGAVGKTLFLAGDYARAIPELRRAAGSCSALQVPLAHTLSSLYLGKALEATNDRDGACKAYQTVLDRWGHATPKSISADTARTRWRALGCSPVSPTER